MERTGHRSVTGVRSYKRTSDVHIENCSAILDGKVIRKMGLQCETQPSENHHHSIATAQTSENHHSIVTAHTSENHHSIVNAQTSDNHRSIVNFNFNNCTVTINNNCDNAGFTDSC